MTKASRRIQLRALWRRGRWVLLGLLVLFLLVWAFMPAPVEVVTQQVQRGPMQVTIEEEGRTEAQARITLPAPMGTGLARVRVEPGNTVTAGMVVAELSPPLAPVMDPVAEQTARERLAAAQAAHGQARAAMERAKVAAEQAREEAERFEGLAEAGVIARQRAQEARYAARSAERELEAARFAARAAAAEVEAARVGLEDGVAAGASGHHPIPVRAPVDGEVLAVHVDGEQPVAAGQPLLELGDRDTLRIVVDVLSTDAFELSPASGAVITRWGGPPLEARVTRVDPSAFTAVSPLGVEEQRVNVTLDLTSPRQDWSKLGHGFAVEARMTTWEADDVLRVPNGALFRIAEGWAVFVVDAGRARERRVVVGRRGRDVSQVLRGLSAGESVVVHPPDDLADGVRVRVRDA